LQGILPVQGMCFAKMGMVTIQLRIIYWDRIENSNIMEKTFIGQMDRMIQLVQK
jgi:hypothetical protein